MAEESKSMNVAVDPSLGGRRWIGPNVTRIAMRQIEREEVRFLLDPAHHNRFAKISLGVARCVVQRDKHLPPPALLIAHVILDDRVAAGEPVLAAGQKPLGRVTLLAGPANIITSSWSFFGQPVQLSPLYRRHPPIPRREHLLHALARNPEVTCRLARAHPVPNGETNLQIQFHGETVRPEKGKKWRKFLLRRAVGTIPRRPWQTFPPPFS